MWAIIGKKGADEDIVLYREKAPGVYGSKKLAFAGTLNSYLKNVASDEIFRNAVDIYADMVIYETMKSYRSGTCGFMFQAVSEQKGKLKDDNKEAAAKATVRIKILKAALQKVIAAEQESDLKKKFEKMMADHFKEE